MGLVSPIASAKRRMAPFSTSLTAAFASRPAALRSTTVVFLPLSACWEIQNADQSGFRALHERRGVDHRPAGGLVALRPARDEHPDAGLPFQLDLVARLGSAQSDGEVQVRHFLAIVEGARHLLDADDPALGHPE